MDEAVQLIAERAAKGPSKPKGRRSKAPGKAADSQPSGNGKAKQPKSKAKAQGKGKGKSIGTREAAE